MVCGVRMVLLYICIYISYVYVMKIYGQQHQHQQDSTLYYVCSVLGLLRRYRVHDSFVYTIFLFFISNCCHMYSWIPSETTAY